jgi:actinin alpha
MSQDRLMDRAWEVIQKRTFTKWCNNHLTRRHGPESEIKDVQKDLKNGVLLMRLINALYELPIPKHNKAPKMRPHLLDNLSIALAMVKEAGVTTHFLSGENIADEDLKMILGMIWCIILDYQIKGISVDDSSAKEGLLLWCKKKTKGYKDVQVDNFHMSFVDGLAFCALIHAHRPDLLNYDSLSKDNPRENLKLAFDVAEGLGIPRLLEIEDLLDVARPDERSVMTYVSEYYHYFASRNQGEVAGKRIGKLAEALRQIEELKNAYIARATDLAEWIKKTTDSMNDHGEPPFGGTVDSVKSNMGDYDSYQKDTKPPKTAEKLSVEQAYNNLTMKLRAQGRPPFDPPAGLSVGDINNLWGGLDKSERDRDQAMRDELRRLQELLDLVKKFYNKAKMLDEYAGNKNRFLSSLEGETYNDVGTVESRLKMVDGFANELEASKPRVAQLNDLGNRIVALKYDKSADITGKMDDVGGKWSSMDEAVRARKQFLAQELERQKKMEEYRLEFAKMAKEYNRWLKDASGDARDHNFGLTLEAVEASSSAIDGENASIGSTADAKLDALRAKDAEMREFGVSENRYTAFTVPDFESRRAELGTLLDARKAALATELERQRAMDAKRKEYAAAADAFIAHLKEKRAAISNVDGEPDAQIAETNSLHNGGAEAKALLADVERLDGECRAMGISDNKYTGYSLSVCQSRLAQHEAFVENFIASLNEDLALAARLAQLRKEAEERERQEALKVKFANTANSLNAWLQNAAQVAGDPVACNSVKGVEALQAEHDEVSGGRSEQEAKLAELRSLNDELSAAGVTEVGAMSELTMADAEAKWSSTDASLNEHASALAAEASRQAENEEIRKAFAAKADEFNAYVDAEFDAVNKLAEGSSDPQATLAALDAKAATFSAGDAKLGELSAANARQNSAGISDNEHTKHTFAALETKWKEFCKSIDEKKQVLTRAISEKSSGAVTAEQVSELTECFNHFDRDRTGTLARDEFKAALSAIGEILTDEQVEEVYAKYGDPLPRDGFVEFMSKRMSATDSEDDILEAFKIIAGDQDYVTADQLRPCFDPATFEYLKSVMPPYPGVDGALDFKAWTSSCYAK